MSTEPSGKPDAWKPARPVWGWGRGETPRPTPQLLGVEPFQPGFLPVAKVGWGFTSFSHRPPDEIPRPGGPSVFYYGGGLV